VEAYETAKILRWLIYYARNFVSNCFGVFPKGAEHGHVHGRVPVGIPWLASRHAF
jgi:hypothetical protein